MTTLSSSIHPRAGKTKAKAQIRARASSIHENRYVYRISDKTEGTRKGRLSVHLASRHSPRLRNERILLLRLTFISGISRARGKWKETLLDRAWGIRELEGRGIDLYLRSVKYFLQCARASAESWQKASESGGRALLLKQLYERLLFYLERCGVLVGSSLSHCSPDVTAKRWAPLDFNGIVLK